MQPTCLDSKILKERNLRALLAEIIEIEAEGRGFQVYHFCCRLGTKLNKNFCTDKNVTMELAGFVRISAQPHKVWIPLVCCRLPLGVILFIWSLHGSVFGGIFWLA